MTAATLAPQTTIELPTTPLGTHLHITTPTGQTWVQLCAIDARPAGRGARISNRMWGGTIDTWVPINTLPTP